MNIKRNLNILLYLFCFQIYRLYRFIINKPKSKNKIIAIQTPAYEGNLVAVANMLKLDKSVLLYWIAYANNDFFKKLKNDGWIVYDDLDIFRIPLFYDTKVFIGTPGFGKIPTKYFKPGKWVDLWHGLPFKGFNFKLFIENMNRFDKICVASDWFKETYFSWGIKKNKLVVTGYARTDKLVNININRNEILRKLNLPSDKKIVFYTPTWEQDYEGINELFPWKNMVSTLDELERFCQLNKIIFLIRPHKLWKNINAERKLRNLFFETNKYINLKYIPFDKFNLIEDLLLITDVLITDWSSTPNDFILLNKPIIFFDAPVPFKYGFTLSPKDRAGYVVNTKDQWFKILKKCIFENKLNVKNKKSVLVKLYGHNIKYADGHATERCVKVVYDLLN